MMLLKTRTRMLLKQHRQRAAAAGRRKHRPMLVIVNVDEDVDGDDDGFAADNFHRAIAPVLFTAQLFGALPVSGIWAGHTRHVHFRWLHPKLLCTGTIIVVGGLEMMLVIVYFVQRPGTGNTVADAAFLIFLFNIIVGLLQMLRLAHEWPSLIRLWQRSEAVFLRPPYRRRTGRCSTLRWRVRGVAFVVLFVALIEHLMYMVSTLYDTHLHMERCSVTDVPFMAQAFRSVWPHVAWLLPASWFSAWMLVPVEWLKFTMTFNWTFVDVLIMSLSGGLAWRFGQLGERIEAVRGRPMPDTFWIEVRSQYLVMVDLLQRVDALVSGLLLQSCASNLFFICYQLFKSFNYIPNIVNAAYFWLSLLFILARTLVTLFCAAAVHDASRRPVAVLRNVPASGWSAEVQRFAALCATGDVVALSGKRFFYVTRGLILAMAGTVATYELVLLDELSDLPASKDNCE